MYKGKVYQCKYCDIITKNKSDYTKHCKTKKHKLNSSRYNDFSATAPNCTQLYILSQIQKRVRRAFHANFVMHASLRCQV